MNYMIIKLAIYISICNIRWQVGIDIDFQK